MAGLIITVAYATYYFRENRQSSEQNRDHPYFKVADSEPETVKRASINEAETVETSKCGKKCCVEISICVTYICLMIMLGLLTYARVFVLCRRADWRNNLEVFPTECGDWSTQGGCTRLVLPELGCVKTGDLNTTSTIVIDVGGDDTTLNARIAECTDGSSGAKLHTPAHLKTLSTYGNLIHITWQSVFFGFIDDMYVSTYVAPNNVESRVINFQSQLRIGTSDFNQNQDHVREMINCLDKKYDTYTSATPPCSE